MVLIHWMVQKVEMKCNHPTPVTFVRDFCKRNVNVCFVFVLWLGCIKGGSLAGTDDVFRIAPNSNNNNIHGFEWDTNNSSNVGGGKQNGDNLGSTEAQSKLFFVCEIARVFVYK